jgi:hypothetical protein
MSDMITSGALPAHSVTLARKELDGIGGFIENFNRAYR